MPGARFYKCLTVACLLASSLFILTAPASGQGADIAVVPAKVEFLIQPGATQSQTVKVYNQGGEAARVLLYTEDYSIDSENSFSFFEPGTIEYSIAPWVGYSESEFVLEPRTSREITITLVVPADATIGGYASLAIFEAHRLDESQQAGVVTIGRIGVPMLTTVAVDVNQIVQEGTILSTQVRKGTWVLFHTDIEVETTFMNTGNTYLHYHPFTGIEGGLIGSTYKEDHGESTALARSERKIEYRVTGAFFGRYKVRVEVYYPPDRVLVQERTVWVIPWLLITIVGLMLALGTGAWLWLRRRRKGARGNAHQD